MNNVFRFIVLAACGFAGLLLAICLADRVRSKRPNAPPTLAIGGSGPSLGLLDVGTPGSPGTKAAKNVSPSRSSAAKRASAPRLKQPARSLTASSASPIADLAGRSDSVTRFPEVATNANDALSGQGAANGDPPLPPEPHAQGNWPRKAEPGEPAFRLAQRAADADMLKQLEQIGKVLMTNAAAPNSSPLGPKALWNCRALHRILRTSPRRNRPPPPVLDRVPRPNLRLPRPSLVAGERRAMRSRNRRLKAMVNSRSTFKKATSGMCLRC